MRETTTTTVCCSLRISEIAVIRRPASTYPGPGEALSERRYEARKRRRGYWMQKTDDRPSLLGARKEGHRHRAAKSRNEVATLHVRSPSSGSSIVPAQGISRKGGGGRSMSASGH